MNVMEKRISKLEQARGGGVEPLIVIITRLEPSPDGPVEREPIGLSASSQKGALIMRRPGESWDALCDRAQQEHPEVRVWVSRYEEDVNEASEKDVGRPI